MICANCGKKCNKLSERAKFNAYNCSSGWKFDEDTPGDLCADCAQDYCDNAWMWGEKESDDGPPDEDDVGTFVDVVKDIWKLFRDK